MYHLRLLNGKSGLFGEKNSAYHHTSLLCLLLQGEMQSLFVIFASFAANGGCQVCHTGVGRGAMRAASA